MPKLNLAVLISGRGSNLQAIINSCKNKDFPARVLCVISNNPKAQGLNIAAKENIPSFIIEITQLTKK